MLQATYVAQQKTPEQLLEGVESFPQGVMLNCEYADLLEIVRRFGQIHKDLKPHGTGAPMRRS
jgi:hypothetical protein